MITTKYLHMSFMFVVILWIASCKDDTLSCPNLTINATTANNSGDVYGLQMVNVVNNCLHLIVSYSGGCANHNFEMRWNGALMESMPPQAQLILYHNGNQDPCDAVLSEHLFYDLNELDPTHSYETIIVHLQNYANPLSFHH